MLKETETAIDRSIFFSLNERCTVCDSILQEHSVIIEERNSGLQGQEKEEKRKQQQQPMLPSSAASLLPRFERASDVRPSKLMFDILQIDSSLDLVDNGALCIMGKGKDGDYHANTLITRLCVRSFLPKKGWDRLDSPAVLFIDAGNCSDIYQAYNFARQFGLNSKSVLDRIIVSRPFTIYQLAGLIIHELYALLQHTRAKIVVITDILHLFLENPQIDKDEARWLIKEIIGEINRISKKAFLAVPFDSKSLYRI